MRARAQGFTLIEMVVVVVILGLAAAVVYPRLDRQLLSRQALRNAGDRIASVAMYAGERAAFTRRTHWLTLDLPGNRYGVEVEGQGGLRAAPQGGPDLFSTLREGLSFGDVVGPRRVGSRDQVEIRLTPEGWADTATIELRGSDGDAYWITVTPVAGVVETSDARPGSGHE